ncbi:MAG: hypothetical protein MJZ20_06920 [Bacteroidaceae bacterium]|nr:hypothetical protein [Bacteroidaceae bacterium]
MWKLKRKIVDMKIDSDYMKNFESYKLEILSPGKPKEELSFLSFETAKEAFSEARGESKEKTLRLYGVSNDISSVPSRRIYTLIWVRLGGLEDVDS